MKSYEFRPDVALADIAFYAYGRSAEELIAHACEALTACMVDVEAIEEIVEKKMDIRGDSLEDLLYNAMEEVIFLKDAERLVFQSFKVSNLKIQEGKCAAHLRLKGETIDLARHGAHADVKAVTYQDFHIDRTEDGYRASVTVDI